VSGRVVVKDLRGVRVLVAGAGLAGLASARDLVARGADVTVVEARERVGGRVRTLRDGFASGQHAEAGADLIDGDHQAVLDLARELGLKPVRILRGGFGYYGPGPDGRLRITKAPTIFGSLLRQLAPLIDAYQLGEGRWDTALARQLGAMSVADWLRDVRAPAALRQAAGGLRGLFLAEPGELSLLAFVDFFATGGFGDGKSFRIAGGNDQLTSRMAAALGRSVEFGTVVRRVRQDRGALVVTLERRGRSEFPCDYLVVALPAPLASEVVYEPALPDAQRAALAHLRLGAATRVLVQCPRRFWKRQGRPDAFGSTQPTGAVWDGNGEQRGRAGILSLLAGGRASGELATLVKAGGIAEVISRLAWLGAPAPVLAWQAVTWERNPWARGGYAYFDPGFDPRWRDWLARPAGRVVFAGEHTSVRWQGYMNGAVESGRRAAVEVGALAAIARARPAQGVTAPRRRRAARPRRARRARG
jgi:monoamine oxidase